MTACEDDRHERDEKKARICSSQLQPRTSPFSKPSRSKTASREWLRHPLVLALSILRQNLEPTGLLVDLPRTWRADARTRMGSCVVCDFRSWPADRRFRIINTVNMEWNLRWLRTSPPCLARSSAGLLLATSTTDREFTGALSVCTTSVEYGEEI